jgi:class 3 adenylate cyclase/tetratricopeptide (TPR) repeat protein
VTLRDKGGVSRLGLPVRSMRCQKCSAENREGAKFCTQCATSLRRLCQKCGGENPPEARFCADCATPLDDPAPVREVAETAENLTGERRHLTVLLCDLVGSTAIAAQLDPEEWRETVAGYHGAAADAITRFGGYVAKYLGDGVMAFFGYPEAHDNDSERAVRAGLALLEAIEQLNEQPAHVKLSARIGIDSGLVVIGKGVGQETDVFGDTPNIAARVQASAAPDTVVITANTHRLVSGLFVVEELGAQPLKGAEAPVQLYRVIQPSGVRGRLEAAAAAGVLTPFVGRDDELRLLSNRWERALDGEGQVALIIGEPGIGKSRLLQRFHEEIAGTPHTWLEATAGPFFQNTPFYPVADLLQQFLGGSEDKSPDERLAQLEPRLTLAGLKPAEAIPLIAPLLNLPPSTKYPPLPLSPEQQRRRLLATLVTWALGAARAQPLVIATEDLHWADPSTLEVIRLLVEQGTTARLLMIYTARPEFRARWPLRAHHAQITLNRLSSGHARTMVGQVAGEKALSERTVATVVERSGGVPLFVEELTRAVLEAADVKFVGREIPATLHDSLMARLDRLGPAKEVIQIGAVLGGEFSYGLLHAVDPIEEEELQGALRKLADAELLYVRGIPPEASYQFKHALIQDAAYDALLKSRRKDLHRLVACTIVEKFAAIKEARPEVLAHHWTEAGEVEPAIAEWTRAGERAVEQSAYLEAERHYRQALALMQTLPESSERDTRELTLQVALGSVTAATRGWSASDTDAVYARARSLAERAPGTESLQVYLGLWSTANTRGETRPSSVLADQMLEIARGIGSPPALVTAHWAQGLTRHYHGDLAGARQHFLWAIEHYSEEHFRGIPNDLGVTSRYFAGLNEWHLGRRDQAGRFMDDALSLARRQNNPFSLANVLSVGSSRVRILRGDFKGVLAVGHEAVRLNTASGFPLFNAICKINLAWARAQMGEGSGAADRIREALAEFDAIKFYSSRTWFLCLLCETQVLAGALDDALVTVEQALEVNPDELLYRPEALRLRADLQLKQGDTELAVVGFREAIELAHRMGAKSDELRATISLARLLVKQNRRDEARARLAGVFNWFTEGFDTADLKDAKALLDELA